MDRFEPLLQNTSNQGGTWTGHCKRNLRMLYALTHEEAKIK